MTDEKHVIFTDRAEEDCHYITLLLTELDFGNAQVFLDELHLALQNLSHSMRSGEKPLWIDGSSSSFLLHDEFRIGVKILNESQLLVTDVSIPPLCHIGSQMI